MLNKIKETWKELDTSIYTGERLEQNLKALTVISIFTAVLGLILLFFDLGTHQSKMLIPSLATFLGGALCAFLAGVLKKREIAIIVPTLFCAVAFTYYAITGAAGGTAILWSFMLPIGISYFVSVKYGIYLSAYYILLYVVMFYTPLSAQMAAYYTKELIIRFPLIYASMAVFTSIAMIHYHRSCLIENEYADRLNAEVERQTAVARERADRLEAMSEEIVSMLAVAIDAKDRYTNGHSFRVAAYSVALATHLGWSDEEIISLRREAMLHDIGKIGIPDDVLNKPGKLTDKEFEIIKSHAEIGGKILARSSGMESAMDVARYHHERYDGNGYPTGLNGELIPLHARIVSVADAYDAMRSDRIYRKGLSPERIHEELVTGRGKQFDPILLEAFLEMEEAGTLDEVTANANEQLKQAAELGLFEEASAWLAHTN